MTAPVSIDQRLRFAASLAAEMGLPGVKAAASEGILSLLGGDGATIFLYDPATKKLTFDAVSGVASSALQECELGEGEGIAGRVAQTRVSELRADASACSQINRAFDEKSGFQTASLVAV